MTEVSSEEIAVTYRSSDFRALYRACRVCRRNALLLIASLPAVFVALSYGAGERGTALIYVATPFLFIASSVVLSIYVVTPWLTVRARRKNGWDEPMNVRLTHDGVSVRHPSQDSLFYWTKIRDVVVRGDRLFLFTTSSCAIILPLHSFASDEHFADWAATAQQYWQAARG